jgi:hypothetical protein
MVEPAKQSLLFQTKNGQNLTTSSLFAAVSLPIMLVPKRPNNAWCIKPLVLFFGSIIHFTLPLVACFLKCGLQEGHFAECLRSLFHFLNGGRGV